MYTCQEPYANLTTNDEKSQIVKILFQKVGEENIDYLKEIFSDLKNTCFELCVIMVEHTIVASKNGTNFFLYMSVNAKAGIHINPSPALAQI